MERLSEHLVANFSFLPFLPVSITGAASYSVFLPLPVLMTGFTSRLLALPGKLL